MSKPAQRNSAGRALELLSIVIPARNEAGCIASTVEHLHLELRLQHVPHEIVARNGTVWVSASTSKLCGIRLLPFVMGLFGGRGYHAISD